MKYLILIGLLLFAACASVREYKKTCHMEGPKEVCTIDDDDFSRPVRDIK